ASLRGGSGSALRTRPKVHVGDRGGGPPPDEQHVHQGPARPKRGGQREPGGGPTGHGGGDVVGVPGPCSSQTVSGVGNHPTGSRDRGRSQPSAPPQVSPHPVREESSRHQRRSSQPGPHVVDEGRALVLSPSFLPISTHHQLVVA